MDKETAPKLNDDGLRGRIDEQAARLSELEAQGISAETDLLAMVLPAATSVQACDEILASMPGGYARYRIREIRAALAAATLQSAVAPSPVASAPATGSHYYAQRFKRFNGNTVAVLEETVVVILETTLSTSDDEIGAFDRAMWAALWEQYPSWVCPYHQSNPPPNKFEKLRHGWSSVTQVGPVERL